MIFRMLPAACLLLALCFVAASVSSVAYAYNPNINGWGERSTNDVTVPQTVSHSDYRQCTNERDRATDDAASLQKILDANRSVGTPNTVSNVVIGMVIGIIIGVSAKRSW